MPTQKLTNEVIAAAIEGFDAQKRRIDEQIGELRAMLSGAAQKRPPRPQCRRSGNAE